MTILSVLSRPVDQSEVLLRVFIEHVVAAAVAGNEPTCEAALNSEATLIPILITHFPNF